MPSHAVSSVVSDSAMLWTVSNISFSVSVCVQLLSCAQLFVTPLERLLCPWDFSGKNTGVSFQAFLQGIFLTQGSNPHLLYPLHWQGFFTTEPPGKALHYLYNCLKLFRDDTLSRFL